MEYNGSFSRMSQPEPRTLIIITTLNKPLRHWIIQFGDQWCAEVHAPEWHGGIYLYFSNDDNIPVFLGELNARDVFLATWKPGNRVASNKELVFRSEVIIPKGDAVIIPAGTKGYIHTLDLELMRPYVSFETGHGMLVNQEDLEMIHES